MSLSSIKGVKITGLVASPHTLSLQDTFLIVTRSQHSTQSALPLIHSWFFCGLRRDPKELPITAFSQVRLPLSYNTSEANWIADS